GYRTGECRSSPGSGFAARPAASRADERRRRRQVVVAGAGVRCQPRRSTQADPADVPTRIRAGSGALSLLLARSTGRATSHAVARFHRQHVSPAVEAGGERTRATAPAAPEP